MSGNTDIIWDKDVSQKPSFPATTGNPCPWIPACARMTSVTVIPAPDQVECRLQAGIYALMDPRSRRG